MNTSTQLKAPITLAEVASGGPAARVRPLLAAALATISAAAADWIVRYQEHRKSQAAHYAMRHLSDHLLRDVGYERGWNVTSVEAESDRSRDRFARSYFDFLR